MIPEPERCQALTLIAEAMQAGARKRAACAVLGLSLRTVQRWEREDLVDRRKGSRARPANALTETERAAVLARLNSAEFAGESPNQVVPKLADRGEYLASEASMYRLLRAEKLLAHRQKSAPTRRHEPTPRVATASNQIWSWDISWLAGPVRGGFFYLYLILDLYSRKIVAWQVHERESAESAAALATAACFLEGITREAVLVLHADNGAAMKGATMLATLQWLGVVPSFSRPRVSDDNPFSEALFRTLKYRPEYPERGFADIDAARAWVEQFVRWYNHEHQHSGIRFVTPHQRHTGEDLEILRRRHALYQEARRLQSAQNLERIAVILAFIAVRLLQLRELFDTPAVAAAGTPRELSCAGVLEEAEWQMLWLTQKRSRPPKEPPPLRWAYGAVAKLGGWLDTKQTGRAGWEAMWHGWFRLQERVDAYLATRDFLH